jgi:hypothetical protein
MPNYRAKGTAVMRALARRGGLASGEARRLKKVRRIMAEWVSHRYKIELPPDYSPEAIMRSHFEATGRVFTLDEIEEALRPVDRRGGSHDNDWRCPGCRHFNSEKRRACAKCKSLAPANGRRTRAALRAMEEEHRTQAVLRKFGL